MDLDPRIRTILEGPNFAHLATLSADGSPHVATVWIRIEDGRLLIVKEPHSVALGNLRRDPRVAVSVNAVEDPYEEAHLRGRLIASRDEPEARALLDRMAIDYTGAPYPDPAPAVILLEVEIEHAGFSRAEMEHTPPGGSLQLRRVAKEEEQ